MRTPPPKKLLKKCTPPTYLPSWLGRPFILNEDSLTWGRYILMEFNVADVNNSTRRHLDSYIKQTESAQLTSVFEHLLHAYCPSHFPDFLREMQALVTHHHLKGHLKALLRDGCSPNEYFRARIATVGSFDEAIVAVFDSSVPLHGYGGLTYVQYRQKLHGMHLTTFADEQHTYDVAFTSDLVLAAIRLAGDSSLIWP